MVALNTSVGASYGQIHIEPFSKEEREHPVVSKLGKIDRTLEVYCWKPAEHLRRRLPGNFQIRLLCVTNSHGVRRFYLLDSVEDALAQMWLGGLAIIKDLKQLSEEQVFSAIASCGFSIKRL